MLSNHNHDCFDIYGLVNQKKGMVEYLSGPNSDNNINDNYNKNQNDGEDEKETKEIDQSLQLGVYFAFFCVFCFGIRCFGI